MKYLLVALVVAIGYWAWRRGRTPPQAQTALRPEDGQQGKLGSAWMVQCKKCGVHLPQSEAVVSEQGVFCCEAHRTQA